MVWYFALCGGAFIAMYALARGPGNLSKGPAAAMAAMLAPLSLITILVVAVMAAITRGEE